MVRSLLRESLRVGASPLRIWPESWILLSTCDSSSDLRLYCIRSWAYNGTVSLFRGVDGPWRAKGDVSHSG